MAFDCTFFLYQGGGTTPEGGKITDLGVWWEETKPTSSGKFRSKGGKPSK